MALYASVKVGFRTVFHFGDRQAAQRRCWFPLPKSRQNHQPVVVLTCQLLMHRVKGHFGSKVSGDFRLAVCTRAASDLGLPDWATYRRLGYLLKLPAAKNGLLGKFRATSWMTWNFGWRIWATFRMLLATFCRKLRQPRASEQTGKMAVVEAWTETTASYFYRSVNETPTATLHEVPPPSTIPKLSAQCTCHAFENLLVNRQVVADFFSYAHNSLLQDNFDWVGL